MTRKMIRHRSTLSRWPLVLLTAAALAVSACATSASNSRFLIVKDGKYGYIDSTGRIVVPPRFEWAGSFGSRFAPAYVCGRSVAVDSKGHLHPWYAMAVDAPMEFERGGKIGFVNSAGRFVVEPVFDDALPFSEGYAAVRVGGRWGFVDDQGRMRIAPQFTQAFYFHNGVGSVQTADGSLLIDRSGRPLASHYWEVALASDGRIPSRRAPADPDDLQGYLNLQGTVAIPFEFEQVESFSEGLAAVMRNGKWGYIDRQGRTVIPIRHDRAGWFKNGLAFAKIGDESGFIDRSGRFKWSIHAESSPGFVRKNRDGLTLMPGDLASFFTDDDRFGYVNLEGRVIWGPTLESPDHRPLFGWSDEGKQRSCDGMPDAVRRQVAGFPEP